MRLHRFYISAPIESKDLTLEDTELIHQWKNVFRYMVGAQVVVFNGDGYDYLCIIALMRTHTATLQILSKKKSVLPDKNIGIVVSLIKKDNMEWIIQKATELGVSKIFPVISERSEKKSLNMIRAQKIATEAAEQSNRGDIPEIMEPMMLEEFFNHESLQEFEKKIVFHPKEEKFNPLIIQESSILIAIGPEGGFSEEEMHEFSVNGFKRYSLGTLILRAETAAIAAVSVIIFGA